MEIYEGAEPTYHPVQKVHLLHSADDRHKAAVYDDEKLGIRYFGVDWCFQLRKKAKAIGGKWNPEKLLWYVRYGDIVGTELEKHIHVDASV